MSLIRSRSHIKFKVTCQGQIKVNIKLGSFLRKNALMQVVCIGNCTRSAGRPLVTESNHKTRRNALLFT